jgi:crotonobetainyl-CoA:carnitine CoA-transferase CaiB-like acyl-CoA transferase
MHEAALYWLMVPAARELVEGGAQATDELPTFGRHACYNVYRTRDGEHVALGALEPKFWQAFTAAVGRPDLAARHLTDQADQQALLDEVRGIFAGRTREEWLALLGDHDLCLTPVNQPRDAFVDPHVTARGTVIHAPGLRAIRPPFASHVADLSPAPALGAHTAEILQGLPAGAATEGSA